MQAFYNGLGYNSRIILDSVAYGRFMNLDVNIASHMAQECTSSLEKINSFQTYKQTSPYSNSYNAGLRNNQNMSYNSMNAPNPPPQGITPKKDKNQDKNGDVQKPVIKLPFPNRHLKSKLDKQFDRIELLIDPGTWNPMEEGLTEAVQTGIGQLNGIHVAIGVMDFQFMGGSMGFVVGEKITRLIEYAANKLLPLIYK
ncbi:uncharacterized protein LOC110712050 [Chenopodium quinoa]|uniref:uncharacterized protein LOC110712050 n=1 Tax=Chenopodium quinoa TaxID=63459 RepID=UPI000B788ECD|nr:uncharacterized protein LOC110712050 [Chenopodium quinoa]